MIWKETLVRLAAVGLLAGVVSAADMVGEWKITETTERYRHGTAPTHYTFGSNGTYSTSVKSGVLTFKYYPHRGSYRVEGSNVTFVSTIRNMDHARDYRIPDPVVTNTFNLVATSNTLVFWNSTGITTSLSRVEAEKGKLQQSAAPLPSAPRTGPSEDAR